MAPLLDQVATCPPASPRHAPVVLERKSACLRKRLQRHASIRQGGGGFTQDGGNWTESVGGSNDYGNWTDGIGATNDWGGWA